MNDIVSMVELANRLGVNESTVRKAVKSGKLTESVIRSEGGRFLGLEAETAIREWKYHFNPAYERTTRTGKPSSEAIKPDEDGEGEGGSTRSLAHLKRLQAEINVQTAAIDLRKKKGDLVEKKKVYSELFAIGQEMRTIFQAVPDRVIDSILAAKSRNEAHTLLVEAINEALNQVADIQNREILK